MDWQDLYFFTVLARTQSLSGAARILQVEHATVGRRLDALEKSLGLTLVDRLPRSRPLTADGQALSQLLAPMQEIENQVRQLSRLASITLAGTVKVSAPPSLSLHVLARPIAQLRQQHPQLHIVLLPALSVAALDQGEADIALRTVRPQEPALIRRKVGVVRFALYGSAQLAQQAPASWGFIAYDDKADHLPQQQWLHQLRGDRPVVFSASELQVQQMVARSGLGAVVLPTLAGDKDTALQRLPVNGPLLERDLWLAVYPDMRRSPQVKTVLNFLQQCIAQEPSLQY